VRERERERGVQNEREHTSRRDGPNLAPHNALNLPSSKKVFDVVGDTVTPLADLAGHEGPVWAVAWSHPKFGSLLASASFDHRVCVWREASPGAWHAVFTDPIHSASVNAVCFAPHECGCAVAAASSDGAVSVLSHSGGDPSAGGGAWAADRIEGAHAAGALAVTWAPGAVPAAALAAPGRPPPPPERRLASGGCDNLVKVWRFQPSSGRWALDAPPLAAHTDWVRDVAWAPSPVGAGGAGSAAAGPATLASAGQDGRVFIWMEDTAAGAGAGGWTPTLLCELDCPAWKVSWAVSGGVLAVTDAKGEVTTWKEALDGAWEQVGA